MSAVGEMLTGILLGTKQAIRGTKNFLDEFYPTVVNRGLLVAPDLGFAGHHSHRAGELVDRLPQRLVLTAVPPLKGAGIFSFPLTQG